MKYPQSLEKQLNEVKTITDNWAIEIPFESVIKWIMQFDSNDFELAVRVIKNLNVIGFEELNNALTVAYSKLERKAIDKQTKIKNINTLFAGIGEGGKSGAMISYSFRLANELSEENFYDENALQHLEEGRIENIVLVDDIISSGNQAITEIRKLSEIALPLGVKNIFLLTAVGMREGIKKVEDETGAYVFSAFEYDIKDTVQSLDSNFYEGIPYEERSLLKDRLEYYGGRVNKSPLGYGGLGGLIVFYYNTPNSTVPIVWSSLNSWIPLFKRNIKVNGIDAYYKQFDKAKPKKEKTSKEKNELNIFVEGKIEETFFELNIEKLIKILGYEKINIMALGGYYSDKLINNLNKFATNFVFVVEETEFEPKYHKERVAKMLENKPHVFMKPIVHYINIDSIYSDEEMLKFLPPITSKEDIKIREFERDFEMRLFKRNPSIRDSLLKKVVERHLDSDNLNLLLEDIKSKITK
jgi:hypothetical protein